jgi:peroxiredoxin
MTNQTPNSLSPRHPVAALDLPLTTGECFVLGATPAERFDLLVFHRGLHCPLCAKYRIELERLMPGFALRRVNVLAIRSDTKELGQEMARKGNINININTSGVRSAPSLSLKSAREWGPYTSASRGKTSIGIEEPALFSEPAVDLLRPDSTL